MAIRKKAAVVDAAAPAAGKKTQFAVEVVHVKTYVTPNGDAYYAGRIYHVTPEKRVELFKFSDTSGVPYFRDYDPARYKKPVSNEPTNLNKEDAGPIAGAAQGVDAEGEIDTAQGVVRLPRGMRRSEKGVTV